MSDWLPYVLMAGVALYFGWRLFGPKPDTAALEALVAGGAPLVDVRGPAEFAGGHLPGAMNVPVGELADRTAELGPKDRPVVVSCASGRRSAAAARTLRGLGFARVEDLGSIRNW